MPATQINIYYEQKKKQDLIAIDQLALKANKLVVCWTSNDFGITPKVLNNFHLYRGGGYASRNKGNEFISGMYNNDPLEKFYQLEVGVITEKTQKPIIGFCGQAKASIINTSTEILSKLYFLFMHKMGLRIYDAEKIISTTYVRSKLLSVLEKSALVETRFIKHKKYRGGVVTAEQKEASSRMFYENMRNTQYTLCYRGNGNFSIRLYETLGMGRIPIIVMSDNCLPFPEIIDWSIFPIIHENEYGQIAGLVSNFHQQLSTEQFVSLQKRSREIFENHVSYKGFMQTFVDKYKRLTH
ncbi:MAG: exostosin family protein [Chitinophagaceae bacterium]|nr:exostosin family protein [Chitinophagaceae bacterium]